ncbi:DUF4168 domain-containing protein [Acuticoccus sp. M5D2P5]|uniref:DUF4168 domain-containing protein n=1 Tax=Acuticoccus kalidii TaxID=2910977 RepID=UPI001F23FC4D|nr:DUF4168 domain-containing protein [Acuticoccus kalidii]MCF3936670.1 DUF4168 domain-containing protein [Acuticoccus kalidii]
MRKNTLSALIAASALAIGTIAAPVAATAQQSVTPPSATESPSVDAGQIKAFAVASLAVQDVAERYNPQIQAAESQQEAEQIRTGAAQEMAQAIQDSGLEVQTYSQIYRAAQNNPELAQAIERERGELE